MKPGVVLLGRRRGAVRAVRRLGLRALIVTDGPPEDDPDARRWRRPFRDPSAWNGFVPELLAVAPVRAVLGTTEASVVPAARLRAALGLAGMDLPTAVRCTDKSAMKRAVRAAGLRCAEHATAEEGLDRAALIARLGLPMVVKSRASSGSRGMRVAREPEQVPEHLDAGRMAESFVHGVEMSVESLVVDGAPVFENPTEYLRPGWANVVPAALDGATWETVRDVNRRAIAALGVERGMTHLEIYVDGATVHFGEMAVRPPGGHLMELIERAYGFDPWEALVRIAVGESPQVVTRPGGAAGVWLFHPGPGRVTALEGVEAARAMPGVVDLVMRVAVGDDVAARVGVGQEVGHVTVTGADRDEVATNLTAAHEAVRIEVSGEGEPGPFVPRECTPAFDGTASPRGGNGPGSVLPPGTSDGPLQEILRCDEPARAHLAAGFLESEGIPATVVGDQSFWADGSMVPKDMRPTVRVPAEHAERARQLLDELERSRVRGEQWLCETCQDWVPPAFTECPLCTSVRPPRRA